MHDYGVDELSRMAGWLAMVSDLLPRKNCQVTSHLSGL